MTRFSLYAVMKFTVNDDDAVAITSRAAKPRVLKTFLVLMSIDHRNRNWNRFFDWKSNRIEIV